MPDTVCTRCNREIAQSEAAFCPFCGAPLMLHTAPIPSEADALLQKASQQRNNRKKLALLQQAREKYPDCLAVEEEWLFQAKLPQKASQVLDYSGIKCHLLHLYLTPEAFDETRRAAMRQEIFGDAQLHRCLALAPSAEAFMTHYLERLSREFIQIFLMGSNQYMPRFMGFQLERNTAKVLAQPVADMLRAIRADDSLTAEQQSSLCTALESAFYAECGGDMRWLHQAMEG
ncbi:MAG: zinc ribbon domain-containing protein [Clostridia bacterium]|nr:zinc ribbon domain-containing protein [Clostridia bacterium]